MSGVKKATVTHSLSRTVSMVRQGVTECAQVASATSSVGQGQYEAQRQKSASAHECVRRELPPKLASLLDADIGQWLSALKRHDETYAAARELAVEASSKMAQFQARQKQSDSRLNAIDAEVASIRASLQGKDWYCDAENARAERLRSEATRILSEMRQGLGLAREAQKLMQKAYVKLVESVELSCVAEREYDRLVNMGKERQEALRIKEENERKARGLLADLRSLRETMEQLDYARFGRGLYTPSVQMSLEEVVQQLAGGNATTYLAKAEEAKIKISEAIALVSDAQQKWKAEKLAAEKAVVDAREELNRLDRDAIAKYSGESAEELSRLYSSLNSIGFALEDEKFAYVVEEISSGLDRLHGIQERTSENMKLAQQREEISQAIMQALYDTDYDTPEYYSYDESDALSDLVVVAAAPGGVGDVKMRLSINGNVAFEVDNIPEGREQLCVDAVRKMQEKLAQDEVRFDVTDWGRAADQNKVHLDVRPRMNEQLIQIQRQG